MLHPRNLTEVEFPEYDNCCPAEGYMEAPEPPGNVAAKSAAARKACFAPVLAFALHFANDTRLQNCKNGKSVLT